MFLLFVFHNIISALISLNFVSLYGELESLLALANFTTNVASETLVVVFLRREVSC